MLIIAILSLFYSIIDYIYNTIKHLNDMEMNDIQKKVVEIISDRSGYNIEDVTPKSNFVNDLDVDSLDLVEIVMDIEREYNIMIPDEGVDTCKIVKDLFNLTESLVK